MTTHTKPVLIPNKCQCIHASNIVCLAGRHQTSLEMAEVLEGCQCRCHFAAPGVEIAHSQWQPIINVPVARNGWQRGPSEVK